SRIRMAETVSRCARPGGGRGSRSTATWPSPAPSSIVSAAMSFVDLYSDTQTRPTQGMRAAMAAAEVGGEQRREDPTTIALDEQVAELLGQEAAVFLPSGTMCNEIAIRLHIRPGGD